MMLADKIIALRKKQGWSQEELAQKLDVTRQSVSKWESSQSVPDIAKIVQLSELFGVTTDHLLKDEEGEEELANASAENTKENEAVLEENTKNISADEAREYIALHKEKRSKMALATLFCVISPVFLFFCLACAPFLNFGSKELTEGLTVGLGVAAILVLVAIAVAMFISCGMKTQKFEYMEKEPINISTEARKLAEAEKNAFVSTYTKYNIIGTVCCILAAVPVIIGSFISELFLLIGVACLLACVGIGVYFFVSAGVLWGAFQRLLEEGDYSRKAKEKNKKLEPIAGIFWLTVTAVFLLINFISDRWDITWVIWPVAGVVFGVVCIIAGIVKKKK